MICYNPSCGVEFTKIGRTQKYCTYECGDSLRSRNYRLRHPDRIRERLKANWIENKPKLQDRYRVWASQNKDYLREYNRKYRADRIEYFRAYSREWYRDNKFRVLSYQSNRKYIKSLTPTGLILTETEWDSLVLVYEGKCSYCHCNPPKLTQDHIVPLSKGGTHTMDNVVPACIRCNCIKGNKDLADFLMELGGHK